MVGRVGGQQKISIGRGCEYLHTVIHEIGEFLLSSEQSAIFNERTAKDTLNFVRSQFVRNRPPATGLYVRLRLLKAKIWYKCS